MNKRIVYIKGQSFGKLVVVKYDSIKKRLAYWDCKCDCGNMVVIRGASLRSGATRSCGCLRGRKTIHGYATRKNRHSLYNTWKSIKNKCYNKKTKTYKDYGGCGITMCDEWLNNPETFIKFNLNNGWNNRLEILRIDNLKGYSPDNIRYATSRERILNRRLQKSNTSGYCGVSYHIGENKWASYIKVHGINKHINFYDTAWQACQARNKFIKDNNLENEYKLQSKIERC